MLPQVVKLKGITLDLLFPQSCIGCGKEGRLICDFCLQSFLRITPPICPGCGSPQPGEMLCPSCASRQSEIDGIRSPFRFEGVMRQAIHQLKYRNIRALAAPLAELLQDYLITCPVPADVLVPVPLHKKRLKERGYNQSGLLARELSKLTNLPVSEECLIRQHYAFPQARTTNVDERRSNVTGAFTCCDHRARDRQVLLIDDVATSGATLDACAKALKSAGAASVWALVMAIEI